MRALGGRQGSCRINFSGQLTNKPGLRAHTQGFERSERVDDRSPIPVQLSALHVARIPAFVGARHAVLVRSSTKVFGAVDAAQTSLIVTSTLPRIALEYVQICSAASNTS